MAGDLEKPVSTDAYATILQVIRDNFADLITSLEFGDPANLPTGAKRINPTSKVIERWSGAAWVAWGSYQQVADMTTAATPDKGAKRTTEGKIKAAAGSASDDVLTVGQYTAADVFAKVLTQDGPTSGLSAQEAATANLWLGKGYIDGSLAYNAPPIAPGVTVINSIPVTGAEAGDFALVSCVPATSSYIQMTGVAGVDVVTVYITNTHASLTIDPASVTFYARAFKR
jgi:hypothetical protein